MDEEYTHNFEILQKAMVDLDIAFEKYVETGSDADYVRFLEYRNAADTALKNFKTLFEQKYSELETELLQKEDHITGMKDYEVEDYLRDLRQRESENIHDDDILMDAEDKLANFYIVKNHV